MGSFLDEKAIINTYIDNYNNFVNDKGKFIEGSPTFVTYYSKNLKASSEDKGLGATVEIIGSNSPIRYNRIEDFPVYNFNEANLQYQYDEEMGLDVEIEGDCIIPPGTIKPLPDDFFSVSYLNKDYLFRVNNVEGSTIGSKFFYKISYDLSNNDINILEERQIEERYNVEYDNIGTDEKSIINESIYKYLKEIEEVEELIKSTYIKNYYDKEFNIFLYDNNIYDNYLHQFIKDESLFIKNKTLNSNIYILPIMPLDNHYDESFYMFLKYKNDLEEANIGYRTLPILKDNKMIKFSRTYKEFYQIIWIKEEYPNNPITNIINGIKFDNNINNDEIVTIFQEFYKNREFLEDNIRPILSSISSLNMSSTLENYILLPCVLFILKVIKNNIIYKKS